MIMREKVDIISQPYDAEHFIAFFSKDDKDIGFKLHICEFNREMEYLFYDSKVKVVNGKTGFIFPNSVSIEDIVFEVERFIAQYKLDEIYFT